MVYMSYPTSVFQHPSMENAGHTTDYTCFFPQFFCLVNFPKLKKIKVLILVNEIYHNNLFFFFTIQLKSYVIK